MSQILTFLLTSGLCGERISFQHNKLEANYTPATFRRSENWLVLPKIKRAMFSEIAAIKELKLKFLIPGNNC